MRGTSVNLQNRLQTSKQRLPSSAYVMKSPMGDGMYDDGDDFNRDSEFTIPIDPSLSRLPLITDLSHRHFAKTRRNQFPCQHITGNNVEIARSPYHTPTTPPSALDQNPNTPKTSHRSPNPQASPQALHNLRATPTTIMSSGSSALEPQAHSQPNLDQSYKTPGNAASAEPVENAEKTKQSNENSKGVETVPREQSYVLFSCFQVSNYHHAWNRHPFHTPHL